MHGALRLAVLLLVCAQACQFASAGLCPKAVVFNSYNFPTHYVTVKGNDDLAIETGNGTRLKEVAGLDGANSSSFESVARSGWFFCNRDNVIKMVKNDNSADFKKDCSWDIESGLEGGIRFKSRKNPNHYIRHKSYSLLLNSGTTTLFQQDSSFGVVCTTDKLFKLDVCDGLFHLTSMNFPTYSVDVPKDGIAMIKKENGTRLRFVQPALNGNPRAVSIKCPSGLYLNTHSDSYVKCDKPDGTEVFRDSASFKVIIMRNGFVRLQSVKNPRHYIRHSMYKLRLDRYSETKLFDEDSSFKINCARIPCETKAFVYEQKYEVARGPHCEFAPPKWWQINDWCKDLPANRPSPINIELGLCKTKSKALKKIQLGKGWHDERKFVVKNNGHSLQADAVNSADLTVTGGHLNGTFNCFQFHFHWGSPANMNNGTGSEHQLFDASGARVPTPMEVHIVCKRLDMTMAAALAKPDAIAVLGAFIHPIKPGEHDGWAGHVIAQVLSNITLLLTPVPHGAAPAVAVSHAEAVELQLRDLLPESLHRYVNYDGAFTTPGCNPVAQWHIFTDSMKIRKNLMMKFATTFFDAEKKRPLENNFRPVMSRHGRELRCSFSKSETSSAEVSRVVSGSSVVS